MTYASPCILSGVEFETLLYYSLPVKNYHVTTTNFAIRPINDFSLNIFRLNGEVTSPGIHSGVYFESTSCLLHTVGPPTLPTHASPALLPAPSATDQVPYPQNLAPVPRRRDVSIGATEATRSYSIVPAQREDSAEALHRFCNLENMTERCILAFHSTGFPHRSLRRQVAERRASVPRSPAGRIVR